MKFGFSLPVLSLYSVKASPWEKDAGPEALIRIAQRAEVLGYDWLAFPDHVLMPAEWAEVFGARWTDVLTAMAFMAGATRRIRLLSSVLIVPYRNPLVAAKAIASADYLSGGRITLGIGTGHMQREFDMLGVPYAERGAITDEYLAAMRELWTSASPAFEGRYCRFSGVRFEPKPMQKPLPVWVGGNKRFAIRRAARVGNGWMPWIVDLGELPGHIAYLREQRAQAGRADAFEVVVPAETIKVEANRAENQTQKPLGVDTPASAAETTERIGLLRGAGATGVQVPIGKTRSADDFIERIERFAAEVMPPFR
jgi:probable F420-dependent oxidoreductase